MNQTRPANPNALQPQQPAQLKLNDDIDQRTEQFSKALPAHIPVERFKRVLLTAVSVNPTLLKADRRTFFTSAMRAATDGLLPDGREGALVIYKTKMKTNGQEEWVEAVQWMPMIAGIRKKVRNSGEIATWNSHVVYEKDDFDYQLGLAPDLRHKPALTGDRGAPIAAYSVALLKSGEVSFEVMMADEIWSVWRKSSKNQKDGKPTGPWKDHEGEMFRKTVARRHSKVLPMSTDLDDILRRDDELYDFKGKADEQVKNLPDAAPKRPQLSDFTEHITEDGEIIEETQSPAASETKGAAQGDLEPAGDGTSSPAPAGEPSEYDQWYTQGIIDHDDGIGLMVVPDKATLDQIKARHDGWNSAASRARP